MVEFIYFEDSWNEQKEEKHIRTREVHQGGVSPTGKEKDDTEGSRR